MSELQRVQFEENSTKNRMNMTWYIIGSAILFAATKMDLVQSQQYLETSMRALGVFSSGMGLTYVVRGVLSEIDIYLLDNSRNKRGNNKK